MKEMKENAVGLRLRVPVTFRITDIDLGTVRFEDLLGLMVVPTVEVHFPISSQWTVKPFVGWGAAWEFDLEKGVWVGTGGIKSEWLADHDPWEYFVAGRWAYNLSVDMEGSNFLDVGSVDARVETRYRTGGSVRGHHWQPGVYGQVFYYWDGARFEAPGVVSTFLDLEYEVGLSLATKPKVPVLGLGLPRISVGYRFGDGLRGVRIRFGEY